MTMLSGLTNRDIAVALSSMAEMYDLNVVVSVKAIGEPTPRCFLRVEWSDGGRWDNRHWGAAVMRHSDFEDYFPRDNEPISPALLFRAVMLAETAVERFYKAALAAGLPPRPQQD